MRQHRNGDLTVTGHHGPAKVRLPHSYVTEQLELGYASTAAKAQGRTVDTAHVLVNANTTRENLYVAATRARDTTQLYVETGELLGLHAERPPSPAGVASDELAAVLAREASERTATEVRRKSTAPSREQASRRHLTTITRARPIEPRAPAHRL